MLRWLGAPKAKARFGVIEDGAEMYRKIQGIVLKWNTGLYEPDEIKRELEMLSGNVDGWKHIPEGVVIPNNADTTSTSDVPPTTASPDQGQDNGTGSHDGLGMDLRDDTLS